MGDDKETTWDYQCPKCGHIYKSPIPLLECRHKCTPLVKTVEMFPIEKDDNADR